MRDLGGHPDYYRAYLRRMENLCRLYPDRGDYLVTLGAARIVWRIMDRPLAL